MQIRINYWVETILNPESPKSTDPNDEIAKYDFRKGASQFFSGAAVPTESNSDSSPSNKPDIKRKAKKKAPEGGC